MVLASPPVRSDALVDVILPAYNGSKVIRNALDSALAQDVALQVIVVDDGSSDDTAAIARSYGPGVTVITQANRGVSGARNTGLAASRAPYIALLDQDDRWQPGKLARQLKLLQDHAAVGLVFTDMQLFEGDGSIVEDGFLATTPAYAALNREPIGDGAFLMPTDIAKAVVRFNFISPSTVLLRREAILDVNGFDEAFRLCDDAECWMRLLHRWRGIAIEEQLVRALVWEGNASLKFEKLLLERIGIGEKVEAHAELFAEGTAEYLRKESPVSYYRLGIVALNAGETRIARKRLKTSLAQQFRLTTALALGATLLPAPLRGPLMRMKRGLGVRWSINVE